MTRDLRHTVAILILLVGIVWSLPIERGGADSDPAPAAYSAADPAEFEITAYRGTLTITGHTRSKHHELRIMRAAGEFFGSHATQADFHPLGVAPTWWDDATIELIASLATMESPGAFLTEDALRIRALVADKPAAEQHLQALRQALPPSTNIDIQLTTVDLSAQAATFCEQQFAEYKAGPVAFEESGTSMRMSAYPVLDNAIALADACRAATVTITGHTDSTGNESLNQQLSLARAEVVAAYINSRGIAAERLIVIGAGSSHPIADNATRHGRSINRRIEIRFTAT